jgi:hypothetical protein
MSHVSKIELEIKDLSILIKACNALNIVFARGQKTYKWYGRMVNPDQYPLPDGLTQDDLGKCDHALIVPDAEYQIGVVHRGNKYLLLCDFWDSGLQAKIGKNGGKLKQAYAVVQVKVEARKRNFRVQEQSIENGMRLVLNC